MMSKNGGPAFPRNGHPDKNDLPVDGMSLRDYFAAAAVKGWAETHHNASGELDRSEDFPDARLAHDRYAKRMAAFAYLVADAMLAQREK